MLANTLFMILIASKFGKKKPITPSQLVGCLAARQHANTSALLSYNGHSQIDSNGYSQIEHAVNGCHQLLSKAFLIAGICSYTVST